MYPRHIEAILRENLSDTRIVLLTGPRQAGKTTLARKVAERGAAFLTLDDPTTREAASRDPVGFIRGLDRAVIDEIQRSPELILAIKRSVDDDPRPGRFLITGSANLLTLPRVADSLAGRMAIVDLLPLSVAEIRGRTSHFLAKAFEGRVETPAEFLLGQELIETVAAGGYPEAVRRLAWRRRREWCLDYTRALIERDVRDVSQIEHLRQMPRLLLALAHHSGRLVNFSKLGSSLGLSHVTTQKYTGILEQLYLTRLLPPWSANSLKRLIKTPKLHFLDAGLLTSMSGLSPQRMAEDRASLGAPLETFILSEVLKLSSWTGERFEFAHFRDKEDNEVDIVIEDRAGKIVGIEVKASATVTGSDFGGLRKLAAAAGARFVLGLVLYDEKQIVPFGPKLMAAPISCLWN